MQTETQMNPLDWPKIDNAICRTQKELADIGSPYRLHEPYFVSLAHNTGQEATLINIQQCRRHLGLD